MDTVEQVLQQLGEAGIAQPAPDFPETSTTRKRYGVHHDTALNEYSLVFWYGAEQTVNFQHLGRYSYSCHEAAFVEGQQGWIFIRPRKSSTKNYWEVHYCSGGDKDEIGRYETNEALLDALNKRALSPQTIVNWVREVCRLERCVDDLMNALENLGKKWVNALPADEKAGQQRHYTTNYLRRSGLHTLILWRGKTNTLHQKYPWDADDELLPEFLTKAMTRQYAYIAVSAWGYGGPEVEGYLLESDKFEHQADSIPELIEAIWSDLDQLMVAL